MKKVKYKDARDKLDNYDIVEFIGKGFPSNLLSWLFGKSHIAIVIKYPEYDTVLLFESTSLDSVEDFFTKKKHSGVQTVSLSSRIKTYNGTVIIRRLECERTPEMVKALHDFRKETEGKLYEIPKKGKWFQKTLGLFQMIRSITFINRRKDLSRLYCIEQVAESFQRGKLISNKQASNKYRLNEEFNLLKGSFHNREIVEI